MKRLMSTLLPVCLAGQMAFASNQGVQNPVAVPPVMKTAIVDTIVVKGRLVLTDKNKMSLYTFDVDNENQSNCAGGCLAAWPPLIVPANIAVLAPFATIQLADGTRQLTVNKLPLYYFFQDKQPGDLKGEYREWRPIPALDSAQSVHALMSAFAESIGL